MWIFDGEVLPTKTNNILIAKSRNYLAFKIQSENYLMMMASCQHTQKYNSKTFTCDDCSLSQRSYGL